MADLKRNFERKAASQLLKENAVRKAQAQTPEGVSAMSAAVAIFTGRAVDFNEAKTKQIAHDLKPDLPFAPTLFPDLHKREMERKNAKAKASAAVAAKGRR